MNDPDLEDMFYASYQAGRPSASPGYNIDPGRIRYEPFFKRMYGSQPGAGAQPPDAHCLAA